MLLLLSRSIHYILLLILMITMICVTVPFSPGMPAAGLDPSWIFGVNQAVAQGLVFGRDIIFQSGPYISIWTGSYHPVIDQLMLMGSLYIAISFCIIIFLLCRHRSEYLIVSLYAVVALFFPTSHDALFFSYPLFVSVFYVHLFYSEERFTLINKLLPLLTVILFSPFGLLVLIKGSFILLTMSISILMITLLCLHKKFLNAALVVLSQIISMFSFWILAGQSLITLPLYFTSLFHIISGYTEAMSLNGKVLELIMYLFAACILFAAIVLDKKIQISKRFFVLLVFSLYLFLTFKAGFVRQDGHVLTAGVGILTASLCLFFLGYSGALTLIVCSFSLLVCFNFYTHHAHRHQHITPFLILKQFQPIYSTAWNGIVKRLDNKNLKNEFEQALIQLNTKVNFPFFSGTTDIYPVDLSYLIASKNSWNPRPIFQSYSVYTPFLIRKNINHLLSITAPDNIIFKISPTDNKLPSMEDGASWPILLEKYHPTEWVNGFLYLHKNKMPINFFAVSVISSRTYSLGQAVEMPEVNGLIYAEISIEKSILGKIANLLYQPSKLYITLNLSDGSTKRFRVISEMIKTGVIISPLIESTAEFKLLYDNLNALNSKKVLSFSISPKGGKMQWANTYHIVFKRLSVNN